METVQLGPWRVVPARNRLQHDDGMETVLEPKVMRVLTALLAQPGEVVSREELLQAVWPNEYVTEHVLSRSISELRKALGDDHREPRFIETIRTRGFRIVAPVSHHASRDRVSNDSFTGDRGTESGSAVAPPNVFSSRFAGLVRWWATAFAVLVAGSWLWWLASHRLASPDRVNPPRPLTSFRGSELDPALTPDGGHIAFSWSGVEQDNYDIYVKAVDDEIPLRLTSDPAEDKNPAWSPDGQRIAFVRASHSVNGLFVVPLLGGVERKLADCVSGDIPDLVWSGDGRFLFYPDREIPGGPSGIVRLEIESREKRRITRPSAHMSGDRDVTVSPDGRIIAFARAISVGVEDLFVVTMEGGSPQRLTFDNKSISGIEWLPETDEILFSSDRDGIARLWSIGATGKANPKLRAELGDHVYDPSYAVRASRLAFERRIYDTNIWLAELPSREHPLDAESDSLHAVAEPRLSVASTRFDAFPVLSPDGQKLAFVSSRSGTTELWVSDVDGSKAVRVTELARVVDSGPAPVLVGEPSWAPDGGTLLFALRDRHQTDLYQASVHGGPPVRLTFSSWNEVAPILGDGQRLFFGSDQTGTWQIWSRRIHEGEAMRVTRGGGVRAHVSKDGRFLFFSRADRRGIWRVPVDGGAEIEILKPATGANWVDWARVGDQIFYRTIEPNPTVPSSIFRFDIGTGSTTRVVAAIPGRSVPGLGLTVSPNADFLLFGKIDRGDGDILLMEGFSTSK